MCKITVVTVCYNAGSLLKLTAESVFNQNYNNFEYIIIDGLSTDDSLFFLDEKKYQYKLVSEKDNGIYDAMNKAINLASGDYIIYMNAGDVFYDSLILSKLSEFLESSYDVVFGDTISDYGYKKINRKAKIDSLNNAVITNMPFCHQSVLVKTSLMRKENFDIRFKIAADFNFFCSLFYKKHSFHYINLPISIISVGGVSDVYKKAMIFEKFSICIRYFPEQVRSLLKMLVIQICIESFKFPIRKIMRYLKV